MSSSLPDSLVIRAGTAADADVAAPILAADEADFRGSSIWSVDMVKLWWGQIDSSWIAEDGGRPVGFAALLARGDLFDIWAAVEPEVRGRGISTSLLDLAERRARELGARTVHAGLFVENRAADALLRARGYAPRRSYYRMVIELDARPPEPEWPPGITPSAFTRDDARAFYDALVDAFADEWHWQPTPFDVWLENRVDSPVARTDLWTIARDGPEIAGIARCDVEREGGFIGNIGVRSRWRRRGLGLALLQHSFRLFYDRGMRTARLGVDADNASGATRLYERAGMRVEAEDVMYEKELA